MTAPYQSESGMEWSSQGLNPTWLYCGMCGSYHDGDCRYGDDDDE